MDNSHAGKSALQPAPNCWAKGRFPAAAEKMFPIHMA
jgi:hypothetical protein